ncbi:MAG: hypothetical protein Q9M91_02200 [Candidatus Dojkabacteria bacterium]|nr:hypothetical protein [Candidatus Dojkabacteria bacterium]
MFGEKHGAAIMAGLTVGVKNADTLITGTARERIGVVAGMVNVGLVVFRPELMASANIALGVGHAINENIPQNTEGAIEYGLVYGYEQIAYAMDKTRRTEDDARESVRGENNTSIEDSGEQMLAAA